MQEQKISLSRSEAFRTMPIRHRSGGLDAKLIASMRHDGMLDDEKETEARDRLLEAQYGAASLRNVMNPRYMRGRDGRQFRQVQRLDGQHIDRQSTGYALFPLDPDFVEKETDMVGMLQSAVSNSEAERNKYLGRGAMQADQTRMRGGGGRRGVPPPTPFVATPMPFVATRAPPVTDTNRDDYTAIS